MTPLPVLGRNRQHPLEQVESGDAQILLIWGISKISKILAGSFSAIPKPIFASKYAFISILQALQDVHSFAPLHTQHLE